jgi:hypothetical protein
VRVNYVDKTTGTILLNQYRQELQIQVMQEIVPMPRI